MHPSAMVTKRLYTQKVFLTVREIASVYWLLYYFHCSDYYIEYIAHKVFRINTQQIYTTDLQYLERSEPKGFGVI